MSHIETPGQPIDVGPRRDNSGVRRQDGIQRITPAIYLGALWLTTGFNMPLAGFNNAPYNMFLVPIMFFVLPRKTVHYAIWIIVILGIYEILKAVQPGFSFTLKGALGIVAFGCVISTAYSSLQVLKEYTDNELRLWLRLILLAIFLAIVLENILSFVGFDIPTVYKNYIFSTNVYSGLFIEPSYVAIGVSPFIFMCVYNLKYFLNHLGFSSLMFLMAITILSISATIMAVWVLAFAVIVTPRLFKGHIVYTVLAIVGICVVGYVSLTVPAIYMRIAGVFLASPLAEGQNGSSLAYLKGMEMSLYAVQHFPLGVAFENTGVLAPHALVSYLSNFLYTLNSSDGTSLLFKGICELGLLFELFSIASIYLFFEQIMWKPSGTIFELFTLSLQFAIFAHWIRDSTYFNGVLPIALALVIFTLAFETRLGIRLRAAIPLRS